MASGDRFPGIDGREIDLVIKARMRAITAVNRMAPALAVLDSALSARANAIASALAGIDSVLSARANAMASAFAVLDSALIARANAMAPALAAIDSALSARAHAMATLAAMKLVLNVQALGEPLDRPVPVLHMTIPEKQHHNCAAMDTEVLQLREQVHLLELQLRGHWLDDTDEYDLEIDSQPWATEEN